MKIRRQGGVWAHACEKLASKMIVLQSPNHHDNIEGVLLSLRLHQAFSGTIRTGFDMSAYSSLVRPRGAGVMKCTTTRWLPGGAAGPSRGVFLFQHQTDNFDSSTHSSDILRYGDRIRRTNAQLAEKHRKYGREEDSDTGTLTDKAAAARSFLPIIAATTERPLFPRQDSAVIYELIYDCELA
jgi:hypothetical protein